MLPKKLFEKKVESSAHETVSRVKWNKLVEQHGIKKLEEELDQIILDVKQKKLREGVMSRKHYYSSKNELVDFSAEFMRSLDVEKIKNMSTKNDDNEKNRIVEEMEYRFVTEDEEKEGKKKSKKKKKDK